MISHNIFIHYTHLHEHFHMKTEYNLKNKHAHNIQFQNYINMFNRTGQSTSIQNYVILYYQ